GVGGTGGITTGGGGGGGGRRQPRHGVGGTGGMTTGEGGGNGGIAQDTSSTAALIFVVAPVYIYLGSFVLLAIAVGLSMLLRPRQQA
ncbi:MAG: hypothetical protein ABR530_07375, partial [Pyrinomonadaceae bacterium]